MLCSFLAASTMAIPAAVGAGDTLADKVLPALAEVVKDRAEEVASQQIRERLSDTLCTGDQFEATNSIYQLGDPTGAMASSNGAIVIFGKTCMFLQKVKAPLLDAGLLRAFRDDLIRGAVRLSGRGLTDRESIEALGVFEDYLLALVSLMSREHVTPTDIQWATMRFAQLGQAAELLRSNAKELDNLGAELQKMETSLVKLDAPNVVGILLRDDQELRDHRMGSDPCGEDLRVAKAAVRDGFERPGAEYSKALSTPCDKLYSEASEVDACNAAQMFQFWVTLRDMQCASPAEGFADRGVQVRALSFLANEDAAYAGAAKALEEVYRQEPFKDLNTHFAAARDLARSSSVRIDTSLLWAARILSAVMSAETDSEAVQNWLRSLQEDIRVFAGDGDVDHLLDGPALRESQTPTLAFVVRQIPQQLHSIGGIACICSIGPGRGGKLCGATALSDNASALHGAAEFAAIWCRATKPE